MRQEILDYISSISLGAFSLSQELPYDNSGVPLYVRNPKRIYVDLAQYSVDRILTTLDGIQISFETTSVKVYFTADAKSLPANYGTLISDLKLGKDTNTITAISRRECVVNTSYDADMLVTELEFRFTKLTN